MLISLNQDVLLVKHRVCYRARRKEHFTLRVLNRALS